MGGISSKDSVRFERRNSRRQSQKNIFHAILNQTKDISNKMNESSEPLTQEEFVEFKRTLENATKRLNSLGGQLKSKNANTYKQACQFVNDTFVFLETRMAKNIAPSEPVNLNRPTTSSTITASNVMEPSANGRSVVQAVVEQPGSPSAVGYQYQYQPSQRDSLDSVGSMSSMGSASSAGQIMLKQYVLKPELPNIQEEIMDIISKKMTESKYEPQVNTNVEEHAVSIDVSPMEQILAVRKNIDELNWQIKKFNGVKYDEDYTSLVCALDENEVILQNISSFGDEIIRQEKKNVYIFIQQCMNALESKCAQFRNKYNNSDSEEELPAPPAPDYPAPTFDSFKAAAVGGQEIGKEAHEGNGYNVARTRSQHELERYSSDEETYVSQEVPVTPGINQPQAQVKRKVVITQV